MNTLVIHDTDSLKCLVCDEPYKRSKAAAIPFVVRILDAPVAVLREFEMTLAMPVCISCEPYVNRLRCNQAEMVIHDPEDNRRNN